MTQPPSDRSRFIALALSVPLGAFGAHRLYAGRWKTALAMAATMGGMGLWWLYDLILILGKDFTDAQGRRITEWEAGHRGPALPPAEQHELLEELTRLRGEMEQLHDRVDFAERLLADASHRRAVGG